MSKQVIAVGSVANDGTGDQLRTAMNKCNSNFTELYTNTVSPPVFADNYAVGDGVTDDTAALTSAANAAKTAGAPLMLGPKVYYINGTLTMPDRVQVVGMATDFGEMIGAGGFSQRDYRGMTSQLRLSSTASIVPGNSNTFRGIVFLQQGVAALMPIANNAAAGTAAVAAFAGTCFDLSTKTTYDFHIADSMLLGFTNGIKGTDITNVYERFRCSRVMFDCNNPLYIANVTDFGIIDRCHCFPFVTAHISGGGTDCSTRDGVAYYLGVHNDWTQMLGCVEYGWRTGFIVEGSGGCTLTNCNADNNSVAWTDSIGFNIRKKGSFNIAEISLIGCKAAGQDTYVRLDGGGTEANGCFLTIMDFHGWGSGNISFDVQSGSLKVCNAHVRNMTTGLNMASTALTVILTNVSIIGATNNFINASSSNLYKSNVTDGTGVLI